MSTAIEADDDLDESTLHVPEPPPRGWGIALVAGGLLGLAAAFTLTVDKYRILADPAHQPSCNINPVLSCESVMVNTQAAASRFPNPLIGLIGFTVVISLGVLVAAHVRLPGPVLGGLAVGSLLGLAFVHWPAYENLYRIGALCRDAWSCGRSPPLRCHRHASGVLPAPGRTAGTALEVSYLIVELWYLTFAAAILIEFYSYWRTLI